MNNEIIEDEHFESAFSYKIIYIFTKNLLLYL